MLTFCGVRCLFHYFFKVFISFLVSYNRNLNCAVVPFIHGYCYSGRCDVNVDRNYNVFVVMKVDAGIVFAPDIRTGIYRLSSHYRHGSACGRGYLFRTAAC